MYTVDCFFRSGHDILNFLAQFCHCPPDDAWILPQPTVECVKDAWTRVKVHRPVVSMDMPLLMSPHFMWQYSCTPVIQSTDDPARVHDMGSTCCDQLFDVPVFWQVS